jgi:hypothetical protein
MEDLEKWGFSPEEAEHLPRVGDLARPVRSVVAWIPGGTISLYPEDLGVATYMRGDNGNIEVLCRGQVCQSFVGHWRREK